MLAGTVRGCVDLVTVAQVAKPSRPRQTRHGLNAEHLSALFAATRIGGNNPALDILIVRLMVEFGAHDEGILGLRLRDLDRDRATVRIRSSTTESTCQEARHAHDRLGPTRSSETADTASPCLQVGSDDGQGPLLM